MSLRPLGTLPLRVSDVLGLVERFVEHSTPCSVVSSLSRETETPSPSKSRLRSPAKSSRRLSDIPAKLSQQVFETPSKSSHHSKTPSKLSQQVYETPSKSSHHSETPSKLSQQVFETPSKSSHHSKTPANSPRQLAETPSLFDRVLSLRSTSSPAGESPSEQYLLDHLDLPLSQATDRVVGQLASRGDRTNASLNTIRRLFNGTRGNLSLRRNARPRPSSRPIE